MATTTINLSDVVLAAVDGIVNARRRAVPRTLKLSKAEQLEATRILRNYGKRKLDEYLADPDRTTAATVKRHASSRSAVIDELLRKALDLPMKLDDAFTEQQLIMRSLNG